MRQVMVCLLLVACRPVEKAPTAWSAGRVHEMAGAAGPRKPSKKPEKREPKQPGDRPVNKNRCLDSAAAGGVVWTAFCRDIQDDSIRKRC
ncbi:MAG TPA: hypothetical protein VEZ71_24380, partial [Archangium sp.]|nr:hypothetical protein [Archangium sp.]